MTSQRTPDHWRWRRRALRGAAVLWLAAMAAACASQDTFKVCTASGATYLCPEYLACGFAQAMCQAAGCGNGALDLGEECDDGNLMAGDGCSQRCELEVCGNGVLDPGEVCDDGNPRGGDGCSTDCKSREVCGNGIVDAHAGEVCDDGNTRGGDGCSADCSSTEVCGNRIIDREAGEVCDDGPGGSPACSASCRSTLSCNNFMVDPGEECDHGLFGSNNPTGNSDQSDCRADCVINRCGDGHVDSQPGPHHEDCDGAPTAPPGNVAAAPAETATCNLDCTFAMCGDGVLNQTAGEQCDDGNTLGGDGCSPSCRLEFCGNGSVDNGELCDPSVDPTTCNLDCTLSVCGDDKVNHAAGEDCDDGNTLGGDGCSAACRFERCGNAVLDPPEECDGAAGLQPCSAACHQERCGNAILDDDDTTGVHEQCDDGNLINGDGCSHECKFE